MKIAVSTVINRPVADVWRWYAVEHVRNHPRWDPDMELEQISEGPIGTRIRRRNRHGRRLLPSIAGAVARRGRTDRRFAQAWRGPLVATL